MHPGCGLADSRLYTYANNAATSLLWGGEGHDRPRSAGSNNGLQARRPVTGAGRASQVAVDGDGGLRQSC
uniref:Uncharacterized protein n=1 Tax=Oryza sativa subsp. japonica TaxID=39947 RepID=Q69TQ5_ORYSJ|nr:hypothetical protein [Oryza sativa Japonica Group]BAD35772.1 hypothetical protein [Oryza sativa Japonica Group]